MKRIAKCTGGQIVTSLANFDGEESFDASSLGACETVYEERCGDNELLIFDGCASQRAGSILLRGANEYTLDEMERALHDSMCCVKRVLESHDVVPGGGAVEASLSIYLENFAHTLGSREQMAIAEFAQALLVIPKTLAINAACDATELVTKLDGVLTTFAFFLGAILSASAGWLGMMVATDGNTRTTAACAGKEVKDSQGKVTGGTGSLNDGLRVAFKAGSVMGFVVVGLGLVGCAGLLLHPRDAPRPGQDGVAADPGGFRLRGFLHRAVRARRGRHLHQSCGCRCRLSR